MSSRYTAKQAEVAEVIIKHGLGMTPKQLTNEELRLVLDVVQRLAREGHGAEDIMLAARFGMRNIWKFAGKAWTALDLGQNITLAKAEAEKIRRRGGIPRHASEIRRVHGRGPEA